MDCDHGAPTRFADGIWHVIDRIPHPCGSAEKGSFRRWPRSRDGGVGRCPGFALAVYAEELRRSPSEDQPHLVAALDRVTREVGGVSKVQKATCGHDTAEANREGVG